MSGNGRAIIVPQVGRLLAISSREATPGLLTVEGLTDSTADILITSFAQRAQVAHQVTQTIGGPEYLYVFGDMLHEISIGLITMAAGCDSEEGSSVSAAFQAWKYYRDKRIKSDNVQLITITFARDLTIRGLVTGFATESENVMGSAVTKGTLSLKGWVDMSGGGSAGASGGSAGANGGSAGGTPRPTREERAAALEASVAAIEDRSNRLAAGTLGPTANIQSIIDRNAVNATQAPVSQRVQDNINKLGGLVSSSLPVTANVQRLIDKSTVTPARLK